MNKEIKIVYTLGDWKVYKRIFAIAFIISLFIAIPMYCSKKNRYSNAGEIGKALLGSDKEKLKAMVLIAKKPFVLSYIMPEYVQAINESNTGSKIFLINSTAAIVNNSMNNLGIEFQLEELFHKLANENHNISVVRASINCLDSLGVFYGDLSEINEKLYDSTDVWWE